MLHIYINHKLQNSPVSGAYYPHFTDKETEAYISVDLAQVESLGTGIKTQACQALKSVLLMSCCLKPNT